MSDTASEVVGDSGIKVNPVPPKWYLDECLEYSQETGLLKWKVRPVSHFPRQIAANRWNGSYSGKVAGYKAKDGRVSISLAFNDTKENYLATRLIFEIMGVVIPDGMVIDHINRIRGDDRWENLRVITQQQNRCNSASRKRQSHPGLPRGVSPNGSGFIAQIQHKKKVYNLGTYSTPELAHAAFVAKAIELRGEFASHLISG